MGDQNKWKLNLALKKSITRPFVGKVLGQGRSGLFGKQRSGCAHECPTAVEQKLARGVWWK